MATNVTKIREEKIRIVRGPIPRAVRKELLDAVKVGELGRLAKEGLRPEVFFHPAHSADAKAVQLTTMFNAVQALKGVLV